MLILQINLIYLQTRRKIRGVRFRWAEKYQTIFRVTDNMQIQDKQILLLFK